MSQIVLSPNAAGTAQFTIAAPGTSTNRTLTLPDATTTLVGTDATQTLTNKTLQGGALTQGTAVASTSGTNIDFTGIPSWVKRVTVMFRDVSISGTSNILFQVGAGSVVTSGYSAASSSITASVGTSTYTAGFGLRSGSASASLQGCLTIALNNGSVWDAFGVMTDNVNAATFTMAGSVSLGGTLDRIRVTTVNGTDTFDAGSINVMYEG